MPTVQDLEQHRAAITGHCYRMLGSASDADDAVQETMVRAWRNLDRFEARSSLRTWLYRIATRVCLDALSSRARRLRPVDAGPVGTVHDELVSSPDAQWIDPVPDVEALPADADPHERAALRQSLRLAFVAALQHLPPRQRAVLLLTEVLGWTAAEAAQNLDMSVAAVNSALQRARTTLARRRVTLDDAAPEEYGPLADRYLDAFERYDVAALTAMMHEEATLSMPPYSLWLRGHEAIAGWLAGRGSGCRGSRLLPTRACGSPAFGHYHPGPTPGTHTPWALIVLDVGRDGRIAAMTSFLDTGRFFPRFGLPSVLTGVPAGTAEPAPPG